MTALDDVVEAIRSADDDGWTIADAIARIPRRHEAGYVTNEEIARYIATKHPVEYSAQWIGVMRQTADAFPANARALAAPFSAYRLLRAHPEKLLEWAENHPGEPLSAAEAEKLRPKSTTAKPKPDAWKQKVDRALGEIGKHAENDPLWTIDALEQTVAMIKRQHPKAVSRGLRAV